MTKRVHGIVPKHPDRAAIEAALARGVPVRVLTKRYGIAKDALYRHRTRMRKESPILLAALSAENWNVKPEDLERIRIETSENWLVQLRAQFAKLAAAQDACLETGNFTVAAQLAGRVLQVLDMLGRAVGEIAQHSVKVQNNIILAPGYWKVRTAIMQALHPFPDARHAVIEALRGLEAPEDDADGMLAITAVGAPARAACESANG
jgi:hypothetical protein